MSDNAIHTGNKPDLYVQEIIKHPDGKTEFKDIGVTWDKANYSTVNNVRLCLRCVSSKNKRCNKHRLTRRKCKQC